VVAKGAKGEKGNRRGMCARKSGDKRKAAKEFPTAGIIKKVWSRN